MVGGGRGVHQVGPRGWEPTAGESRTDEHRSDPCQVGSRGQNKVHPEEAEGNGRRNNTVDEGHTKAGYHQQDKARYIDNLEQKVEELAKKLEAMEAKPQTIDTANQRSTRPKPAQLPAELTA